MARRLSNVTLDNLDDLPTGCRKCVFWELDPVSAQRAHDAGDTAFEKEAWVSTVLLESGSCGKLIYVDNIPAGYVLYAPPLYAPRSLAFPTSPVSADAALLITGHVLPEFAGQGLGRVLVQGVVKDLLKRGGFKAIEAFGDAKWRRPACMLPADALLAVGFKTVRQHSRYPRLRLDLRSAVTWREDVEVAIERLLGAVRPETAPRPV
jgi:GNAT superfamily N-acetyltransferase